MNQKTYKNALPNDYELHWYKIKQVLGQGAFGMTYLAHDKNLDRLVAIKEYLPGQLSQRNPDLTVQPTSTDNRDDFEWGLKRFISEARTLTKFVHPNLVGVFNVFEMNSTAYMVMNYEIGKDLQSILKTRKTLREDELMKILVPLLSGLDIMHEQGFIHRDIKPGNIFIRKDGSPVLLDFGSARQTRNPRGDGSVEPQTLTNFVSPGYAPIEQYAGKSDRQGPWTDIYGMGATLYKAVTGEMPLASIDRSETIVHDGKDAYISVKKMAVGEYSDRFLSAIDHALQFKTQDRPQNISQWQKELGITQDDIETVPVPESASVKSDDVATVKVDQQEQETFRVTESTEAKTQKIQSEARTIPVNSKDSGDSFWSYLKYIIGGAVAGLLIISTVIYFIFSSDKVHIKGTDKPVASKVAPPSTRQEPEDMTVREEITVQEIETVEETPAGKEMVATTDGSAATDNQQKIAELLSLAEKDFKELRLTSPKDNNAFDKYLAVLKLDEENEAAKQGIQAIADRYISLAYRAMDKNELDQAKNYLRKARSIQPDSNKIVAAQQELQERLDAQEKPVATGEPVATTSPEETVAENTDKPDKKSEKGTWDNVKDWFKETAEKNEAGTREDTTSDKVRKSLGGQ